MSNICIVNRFNLNSAILSIHRIKTGISVVTQDYQACIIENNVLKKRTKLINSKEIPHKFAKSSSASAKFICVCDVENPIAIIATIGQSIKKSTTITAHQKNISASNFSPDSSVLATGGEDGRVYLYTTSNFKKILALPYRPDYISSINFSNDGRFVLASCFNKSNVVYDIQRAKTISIFSTSEVVEWGEFFDNNAKLMLITRDFQSIIYDTHANSVLNAANIFNSWPNAFCIDEDAGIAIVGTRDGGIYLVDIKENAIIFHLKLEEVVGISAICVHLGCIFVGGINGELLIISYTQDSEAFQKVCEAKDYAKASAMLESNIFLSLLPCAQVFNEDWEKILKEAIALLSENKIDDAIGLTSSFTSHDINKRNAFNVYLEKKDFVKKFKELVENHFYEEAYAMVSNTKFLAKTAHYEMLESAWQSAFVTARKIIEENRNNIDLAKRHLEPFMKTPKKEIIMQLLNNTKLFDEADEYIKTQNFKAYFSLVGKFGFLKESILYRKVLGIGENIFDKVMEAKNADNYDEFNRLTTFLSNFPFYKESIANMTVVVAKKIEMLKLIAENKKAQAYKLALDFEELQYLDEFKALSAEFDVVAKSAIAIAHSGKPEELGEIFGEYIQISYWADKIKAIFQVAYLEQFRLCVKNEKDAINWEHSIINYIQIFGKDDDINAFCEKNGFDFKVSDFARQPFSFQKTLISRVV